MIEPVCDQKFIRPVCDFESARVVYSKIIKPDDASPAPSGSGLTLTMLMVKALGTFMLASDSQLLTE